MVDKPLTSVKEDYLEAIVELDQDKKVVRVKDIAKWMEASPISVRCRINSLQADL